jgi:phage-related protein
MGVWSMTVKPATRGLKICSNRYILVVENMAEPTSRDLPKPVRWVGSSKEDLSAFPEEVRRRVGGALWDAQIGQKAPYAKPLKGFGGAGVLEIVDDFDGDTFRAVYTGALPRPFMYCMPSRKNPSAASRRQRPIWI